MIKKNLIITLFSILLIATDTLSSREMKEVSFEEKKPKKEEKTWLKPLLFLAGSVVIVGGGYGVYRFFGSSSEETDTGNGNKNLEKILQDIHEKKAKKIRSDVIIPQNHLLTQDPDHIKVTELDYSDPKLFEKLNVKPDDILLMNGANPTLGFGQGGTNKALSILITKLTEQKSWGIIRDLQDRQRVGNINLGLGGVFISTTNTPNKPKISVIHVLGPNKVNTPQTQAKLTQSIHNAVLYAIEHKKHIMVCGVSTGIYSSGEKMTNDMYKASLSGVTTTIQNYKNNRPNTPISTNIYFNLWHRDIMQHMPNKQLYPNYTPPKS